MVNSPQLTEEQQRQWEEKLRQMSPEELREFQKQQCVFCRIISGQIPSKKVFEDKVCLAVLDIAPAAKGHLIIIPKEHFNIMPQVPDQILGHIMVISKRLSQIILRSLKVSGTTIFAANGTSAGQRAQHFIIHLIPRKEGDQLLNFDEKIVPKELVTKIKTAVEAKLLEISGLSNAVTNNNVVSTEDHLKKSSLELNHPENKGKITTNISKKVTTAKSSVKSKSKPTKKPKLGENTESASDNTLDEIANLFK